MLNEIIDTGIRLVKRAIDAVASMFLSVAEAVKSAMVGFLQGMSEQAFAFGRWLAQEAMRTIKEFVVECLQAAKREGVRYICDTMIPELLYG